MHFVLRNLNQDVTYWAPSTQNIYGQTGYAAPVLMKGRWQGRVQEIRKPSGDETISQAEVFLDGDVVVGGFLALGDYVTPPNNLAVPPVGSFEIQLFVSTPDLRSLGTERRAYL